MAQRKKKSSKKDKGASDNKLPKLRFNYTVEVDTFVMKTKAPSITIRVDGNSTSGEVEPKVEDELDPDELVPGIFERYVNEKHLLFPLRKIVTDFMEILKIDDSRENRERIVDEAITAIFHGSLECDDRTPPYLINPCNYVTWLRKQRGISSKAWVALLLPHFSGKATQSIAKPNSVLGTMEAARKINELLHIGADACRGTLTRAREREEIAAIEIDGKRHYKLEDVIDLTDREKEKRLQRQEAKDYHIDF